MLSFLPKEVREGLEKARQRDLIRKSRLRIVADDRAFPVIFIDAIVGTCRLHRSPTTSVNVARSRVRTPRAPLGLVAGGALKTSRLVTRVGACR